MTRLKLLLAVGCAAALLIAIARVRAAIEAPRLTWIATAHQLGPVGYRDPVGGISPDGQWIAYSEGRFLRVRPVEGGAGVDFEPGSGQIRHLAWSPDSRAIVADGYSLASRWGVYDRVAATHRPLTALVPSANGLRQVIWTATGGMEGIRDGRDGAELVSVSSGWDGVVVVPVQAAIAFPVSNAKSSACITTENGRSRVTSPCGGAPLASHPQADAYGPIALSPDGTLAYVGLANQRGTVDLWSVPVGTGEARQLTSFSRDSYAPSIAADGSVVFKVQSYRTHVAFAPAAGGTTQTLATFQSETPSWDPTGKLLGITYGTWRRVPDDAKYPDIAQDAGIIPVDPAHPSTSPSSVVHDSASEDQSLCWSPNGKWIAFHSHKDMSDDIWLRSAAGDPTARRITMLGRGAEAGWPRWSADGRWLLFTGASKETRRPAIYVIGMNQETGEVREPARQIVLDSMSLDVFHAEWIDAGDSIAAVGREAPGHHVLFTVKRSGTTPTIVHRFASEHDTPGLGVSPDGKELAFIAPANDGFFQVFRIAMAGGSPVQVTTDPSNKTQPAWSPDGRHIAFTVWNYEAQFWRLEK